MRPQRFLWPILALLLAAGSAAAADLHHIDRTIAREPAYKSKAVKYALLVFGPDAGTRVWLVLDGDTLYVDRNGNGDLTEPGKKVQAEKNDSSDPAEGVYSFKAGDIHAGPFIHKNLSVNVRKIDFLAEKYDLIKTFLAKNPAGRGYSVMVEVEMPLWKGTGVGGRVTHRASYMDMHGLLQFAATPPTAPIIHFGGPWQVTLDASQRLTSGREPDLTLGVGTPGLGGGTMAWIDYEGVIPEKVYPMAEIIYPPSQPGSLPVRETL